MERLGKRKTFARKKILELLSHSDDYLSVNEIFSILSKTGIGIATVYRNMDLMEQHDMVIKVTVDGVSKYKLKRSEHQHHLICMGCGSIIDIQGDCVDKMKNIMLEFTEFLEDKYDFFIDRHVVDFLGFCEECNKKNRREK